MMLTHTLRVTPWRVVACQLSHKLTRLAGEEGKSHNTSRIDKVDHYQVTYTTPQGNTGRAAEDPSVTEELSEKMTEDAGRRLDEKRGPRED